MRRVPRCSSTLGGRDSRGRQKKHPERERASKCVPGDIEPIFVVGGGVGVVERAINVEVDLSGAAAMASFTDAETERGKIRKDTPHVGVVHQEKIRGDGTTANLRELEAGRG
uniref:Uncharacterized protein n=1 Tax=Oryza brachyantha TaxID=4533 RepID=J3MCH1_ORYBR